MSEPNEPIPTPRTIQELLEHPTLGPAARRLAEVQARMLGKYAAKKLAEQAAQATETVEPESS